MKEPRKLLKDLPTPAFVINRHAFTKNCQAALEHAKKHNLRMRPHVKTHKTCEGAFIQATGQFDASPAHKTILEPAIISGFVASTLPEVAMLVDAAQMYGGAPFNDILYGVPIAISKLASLFELKRKMGDGEIRILVDHVEQIRQIEAFVNVCQEDLPKLTAFLKLDTGYHRAGVPCNAHGVEVSMAILGSPALELVGLYSHWCVRTSVLLDFLFASNIFLTEFGHLLKTVVNNSGHAYDEADPTQRDKIAKSDLDQINHFLNLLQSSVNEAQAGGEHSAFAAKDLVISVGSTPSLVHHKPNTEKVVEIHPGNYTLYDRQQLWTGACSKEDNVAGRVVAKVIGHYEDRNTILLDAGALALTKDTSPQGGMCQITGFSELEVFGMSQEVAKVRPKDPHSRCPFEKLPIGATVTLLPNHSCLSAACFAEYFIIDDPTCSFTPEEPVVDVWTPVKYFSTATS